MKIKILHILTELELTNGVTSYVMNHYERLNHKLFKVDFLIVGNVDKKYLDMIEGNKDSIIRAPRTSIRNFFKFKKHAKELFSKTKYDIIHSHVFNWSVPYIREAKKKGVKVRIFHAHTTQSSTSFIKKIRNDILIPQAINNSNHLWSCSNIAGDFFFKDKEYYLSHNAIDGEKFLFNKKNRNEVRELIKVEDNKKVIGFFGRFGHEKNLLWALEVFEKLSETNPDYYFLMIGSGKEESKVYKYINESDLAKKVIVLLPRQDIYKFYSGIDLFMLTSLYEGLPVVGVEALFSNLPQIYSSTITKELNLMNSIKYLSLEDDITVWTSAIEEIFNEENIRTSKIDSRLSLYDINKAAVTIQEKYISLVK